VAPDPHGVGAVAAGFALVHHAAGEEAVELEHVVVLDADLVGVSFHAAQAGEVVQHLALRAQIGRRQLPPLFQGAHLLQGEGFPSMAVEAWTLRVRCLSAGRGSTRAQPPRLDALPQRGHSLHQGEQARADREVRFVGHGSVKHESSDESSSVRAGR